MKSHQPMGRVIISLGMILTTFIGCSEDRAPTNAMATTVGFHPEQFPDIPMPRSGYQYDPEYDQLALAIAGGSVRRFEVSMIRRDNAVDQSPIALLTDYRRDLTESGWTLSEDDDHHQRWIKNAEELRLEAGRSGGRTTLQFRLRPIH